MNLFLRFLSFIASIVTLGCVAYYGYAYLSNHAMRSPDRYDWSRVETKKNIVPVAIIGSGPAGLSAALYTARAHVHTVVFQGPQAGGQLMSTSEVENWPGIGKKQGPAIMQSVSQQAQQFGAVLLNDTVKKINCAVWPYELTLSDDTLVHALSVIISTGASPERLKDVPGEHEYWGKGVTACAICDAAFYKDKDVVVVGGGDSAAEQALQLTAYARHITLLVRGDKMRASVAMQERLKKFDYINVLYNTVIKAIEGDGQHVTGLTLQDANGSRHLPIDGVFLAIGHTPNTALVKDQLACTPAGYIQHACRTQETSRPGIFAAGDVSDERYRQAAVASGDGVKAALDAERFLQRIGFDELYAKKIERKLYDPIVPGDTTQIMSIDSVEQFKEVVLKSSIPVIIDFYTKHCAACAQMLPAIQAVAGQMKERIMCVKVDIEKVPELKERYQISTVPFFVVIKQGLVVGRYHDLMTKPGYSAAIYGGNARIETALLVGPRAGGQLATAGMVENMPGVVPQHGYAIIDQLEHQAQLFGATILYDTLETLERMPEAPCIKITTQQGSVYRADAVIIATGSRPRLLGVKGEAEFWGKGVSSCAICDCTLMHDNDVVIVGGGDAAIEEALQLAPYARTITLLLRGNSFRASPRMQEKLLSYDHISYRYATQVHEIFGDESGMQGVTIYHNRTGEYETICARGLFLALGQLPESSSVADLVSCDAHGYIILTERQKTSVPGIFAAGDVTDSRYRQAIVASGDGAKAALDAIAFLRGTDIELIPAA
ncbi:unnamed protein product [Sphagnum balticum]